MEIQTPENKFKNVSYNDSSFQSWIDFLGEESDKKIHHLCLFLGTYEPNKKQALKRLESRLSRKVQIIDADNLVSKIESVTYKKLDELFNSLNRSDDIIYLKNGDKLCGSYTGFTHSQVKYATPQERYFLSKVKAFKGLVIVDIDEFTNADTTLRRAAKSVISFTLPDSKLKRFMWHFKNYSFNGYDLRSKRPEVYSESV